MATTITANQISFSPNFLRGECSVRIEGVGAFELNYLEMRELESKVLRMKNFLNLEKRGKTPKQYIKENIANSYNQGFHNVKEYISRLLNFLDTQVYDDTRKKAQKEEKLNLIENLKTSELFSSEGMKNFDPDNRFNKSANENNLKYSKQCRKEVKDLYNNVGPKKFSDKLLEKLNEDLDYDFVLEGISQLNKEDTKLGGMIMENLSYELNRVYDKDYFNHFFSENHGSKYENDFGLIDKIKYGNERDQTRVKQLETIWKGIEMIEDKTGLLCCGVDGSGEFIDVEKLKKKFKGEIKSWMYIYSDGNGRINEFGDRGNKIGIMSMGVFDGTNTSLASKEIKDLRTYRLDRKIPENFLFEGDDKDILDYEGFEYNNEEDLSELLTI